jgi:uncharacterized protein YndB with AHSA1/START domain
MTESLEMERELDADLPTEWHALTAPGALRSWLWPPRLGATVETDPRVGGSYRIESRAADMAVAGEYRIVDEPNELVFTWQWDGEEEQTLVAVRLRQDEEGTTLVLMHGGFATEESRDEHIQGWTDCLDRLPEYLARDSEAR